jgi:polyether ionophore transport system permease protein
MAGLGIEIAVVAVVTAVAMAAASISASGALWMGADLAVTAGTFAGVGALASQIGSTRRSASSLASLALGVAFALRVVADTTSGYGWVRWTTPLGWAEELRPLTAVRPAALIPGLMLTAALALGAGLLASRRDVGTGIVSGRDTASPHTRLLRSTATAAVRDERTSLTTWLIGTGAFAVVVGSLSGSIAGALSPDVRRQLVRLGAGDIIRPAGFLAFYFSFFTLAVCIFACTQVAAARREEGEQRAETLLALPLFRLRWLAERLAVAASMSPWADCWRRGRTRCPPACSSSGWRRHCSGRFRGYRPGLRTGWSPLRSCGISWPQWWTRPAGCARCLPSITSAWYRSAHTRCTTQRSWR